jgi:hypothetical protein
LDLQPPTSIVGTASDQPDLKYIYIVPTFKAIAALNVVVGCSPCDGALVPPYGTLVTTIDR